MTPGLYVMEHKSTISDIGPGTDYWRKLIIDIQVDTYLEFEKTANSVLYDVLRKPQQQPLMATPEADRKYTKPTKAEPVSRLYANQREVDETPEEFKSRVLEVIKENPDRFYQRQTISRLDGDKDEAALDRWQTGVAIKDARRLNAWPRNSDACMQWGRACDYMTACAGESDITDPFLYQITKKRHSELDGTHHHDGRELLTQSSMRAYRACPRRYFYRYEKQIRRLVMDAKPLRVGTGIHKGLEVWWRNGGAIAEAIMACEVPDDPYETARAQAMLIGYHVRWIDDMAKFKIVSVEKEYMVDLKNPETGASSKTWVLAGKIDSVVEVIDAG